MEWINVKNRLPEFGKAVLVYSSPYTQSVYMDGNPPKVFISSREDIPKSSSLYKMGLKSFDKNMFRFCVEVTHWMPLPDPPKQ